MQDWLNARKLDRKALGILAANLAGYEAYHEHVADEVHATMESMLEVLDPDGARRANPPEATDTTAWPAGHPTSSQPQLMSRPPPAEAHPTAQANDHHAQAQAGAANAGSSYREFAQSSTRPDRADGHQPGHVSFSSDALTHPSSTAGAHWQPSVNASNAARRPKSPWDVPEDEAAAAQSTGQDAAGLAPPRTAGASLIQGLSWDRTHAQPSHRDSRGRGPADGSRASGENGDMLDVDAFIACREGSPDGNSLKPGPAAPLRNAASELRRLPGVKQVKSACLLLLACSATYDASRISCPVHRGLRHLHKMLLAVAKELLHNTEGRKQC